MHKKQEKEREEKKKRKGEKSGIKSQKQQVTPAQWRFVNVNKSCHYWVKYNVSTFDFAYDIIDQYYWWESRDEYATPSPNLQYSEKPLAVLWINKKVKHLQVLMKMAIIWQNSMKNNNYQQKKKKKKNPDLTNFKTVCISLRLP